MFNTLDGHIVVQVVGDPIFRRWTQLVGQPQLTGDRRFRTDALRGKNGKALSRIAAKWAAGYSTAEALALLDAAKVPAGPVLTTLQMWSSEEIQASGYFSEVDDHRRGKYSLVGSPVGFLGSGSPVHKPAPASGEQAAEVLSLLEK